MSIKNIQTLSVRSGIASDKQYGSVIPPMHLSTTYAFKGFKDPNPFEYGRTSNPTRNQLAETLADLEQGTHGIVTSTGMSAILLVLQLLSPEDLLVIPHDCYGGSYRLFTQYAEKGLFKLKIINFTQPEEYKALREQKPRLVWLETPANPLLTITDIEDVVNTFDNEETLIAVDNTFLSPALQQPLTLGADIVIHSTTKYLNGHSDVVGGAVITKDKTLGEKLSWWANCIGVPGAPFDSYQILRGIRTLVPRIKQHQENAAKIVDALVAHPNVTRVYYPGLDDHPGHEIAKKQQAGFGGMVSFEIKGNEDTVKRFFSRLNNFTLAESLGGTESLICHPASMTHAAMSDEALAVAGVSKQLIRISVGIEDADDLVSDITKALDDSLSSAGSASPRLLKGLGASFW